jgi:uncharacterized linocin/CFP29 family protein
MYILLLNNDKYTKIKMSDKEYTITKKIAKHGSQAIIVIPRILESKLKPGTLAEIQIKVIEDSSMDGEKND